MYFRGGGKHAGTFLVECHKVNQLEDISSLEPNFSCSTCYVFRGETRVG